MLMTEEETINEHEPQKKELPCLKCGKIILTSICKRICSECDKINKGIRRVKCRVLTGQRTAKQSKFSED